MEKVHADVYGRASRFEVDRYKKKSVLFFEGRGWAGVQDFLDMGDVLGYGSCFQNTSLGRCLFQ